MALSEIEAFMWRRKSPVHIRDELDVECRVDGQSVDIFELRPQLSDLTEKQETQIAKRPSSVPKADGESSECAMTNAGKAISPRPKSIT